MFVPLTRSVANRAKVAAAWLRAFAFLEDGRPATSYTASERQLPLAAVRATSTDHGPTSRNDAHAPIELSSGPALRARTPQPRLSPHVHRRRPGEVAPRPMPCLTPLPPRPVALPALANARSAKRVVTRRLAP